MRLKRVKQRTIKRW